MKTGLELVSEERQRQINREGFGADHDDRHQHGELVTAAIAYATPPDMRCCMDPENHEHWPWDAACWKPTPDNRERELVKAAALLVAEIDRLQRHTSGFEEVT